MNIYIISDMHIKFCESNEDRERRKRAISFLDSLKGNADLLILNGDIFDLWYDWKSVIIKGFFPILKKLADLQESGCQLILIPGNHDFWFGDFFPEYLQVKICQDQYTDTIDGKKILVTHGDLHTSNDLRYHIFRSVIRTGFVRTLFGVIHPNIALWLGRQLSRSSRKRKVPRPLQEVQEKGLREFAEKSFDIYDIIVMGHSHQAVKFDYPGGVYLNSGEWFLSNSYVKIIDGKAELCQFTQQGN